MPMSASSRHSCRFALFGNHRPVESLSDKLLGSFLMSSRDSARHSLKDTDVGPASCTLPCMCLLNVSDCSYDAPSVILYFVLLDPPWTCPLARRSKQAGGRVCVVLHAHHPYTATESCLRPSRLASAKVTKIWSALWHPARLCACTRPHASPIQRCPCPHAAAAAPSARLTRGALARASAALSLTHARSTPGTDRQFSSGVDSSVVVVRCWWRNTTRHGWPIWCEDCSGLASVRPIATPA